MAFSLSASQRRTVESIVDTFYPALSDTETSFIVAEKAGSPTAGTEDDIRRFCQLAGSRVPGAMDAIERALRENAPPDIAKQLGQVLSILGTATGTLALTGYWGAFADLPPESRQKALQGLATSRFQTKVQLFRSLRSLVCVKLIGGDCNSINPLWAAIGCGGPPSMEDAARVAAAAGRPEHIFTTLNDSIGQDTTFELGAFDAVVVGSGCGGSVVAAHLAGAGKKVLILEKGPYVRREEFRSTEDEFARLYERGGLVSTEDTHMSVLAGSSLGGGTTVNWACCLRTQQHVREEWAREHGLEFFASPAFDEALDAVCTRLGVKSEGVAHNRSNQMLIKGCEALGYEIDVAPQNMRDVSEGAPGAGRIAFGDRYGIKANMPETYLKDAATAPIPAQILDQCRVDRVIQKNGSVTGVVADVLGKEGAKHKLTVHCSIVVVSCGAIQSPALLMRSHLPGMNQSGWLGRNLRLHPVVTCSGLLPEDAPPVDIWAGAPMTTVSNAPTAGRHGDYYGSKLESPSALPGLVSALMPWQGGASFKSSLLDMRRLFSFIVLSRDKGFGEVRLDRWGEPRLYYPVADHDKTSLLDGLEMAVRATAAAGASRVSTSQLLLGWRRLPDMPREDADEAVCAKMTSARDEAVEALVRDIKAIGVKTDKRSQVFSAHQMGTCRMSATPDRGIVKPTGETWAVKGLYVADASTFPTSSGTNPMVTTLAIAHTIGLQMVSDLGTCKTKAAQLPSRL